MMGCGAQVMAQVMQQLAAAGEPPRQALVAAWVQPGGGAGGVALAEVLGDLKAQLALSLAALLPWLCLHFRHSPHAPLAALCILVCPLTAAARNSFASLLTTTRCSRCRPWCRRMRGHAQRLGCLSWRRRCACLTLRQTASCPSCWRPSAPPFASPSFPGAPMSPWLNGTTYISVKQKPERAGGGRYGLCALQRWMEVLQRGQPEQRAPALLLLRTAFRARGLVLGAAAVLAPSELFAPAAAALGGALGGEALQTLAAALAYTDTARRPPSDERPLPQWPDCCEATGEDRAAGVAALARLAAAWQPGRRPAARGRMLPFLLAPGPAAA